MSAPGPAVEPALRDQRDDDSAPIARVRGEKLLQLPRDLYIPPDALEVILEAFEGPLDLLLYLIKRQNLDILDIPIRDITEQYVAYISVMEAMRFELAAEYLLMAAMLAEIKSRMLLPRAETVEEDEEDPRAELIRRLQEYEQIKTAAQGIDALPRLERDNFCASAALPELGRRRADPYVDIGELLLALQGVMQRASREARHRIAREPLSVRERMSEVLGRLDGDTFTVFSALFDPAEGRLGVVVNFLAVLELIKESLVELQQAAPFAPIYLRARGGQGDGDGEREPPPGAAPERAPAQPA